MTNQTQETPVIQRKSAARQAADLLDKVEKMKAAESGIVEAARMKHRAKTAKLVAGAPKEVQVLFYALNGEEGLDK